MKRKIIKQGHNTLTVTLPSSWVRRLNLHSGDEVDLQEHENVLSINAQSLPQEQSCVIDITDFSVPLLWRYFQSAYRAGCDEIKIVFDANKKEYTDAYHFYTTQYDYAKLGERVPDKPALAMIQEVVNRFIGVDIMDSGEGYCIIKEMAQVSLKEFDHSMRRIFYVMLQMFDRIIEALEKNQVNDKSLCKELHAIDLNVDKLVDYCARVLNKISTQFPEHKKSLIFSTLFLLELVGDEFKYVGKHIALSKKPLRELLPLTRKVKKHFELYHSIYYSYDRKRTIEFGNSDMEVYELHFKTKNKLQGEAPSTQQHLMIISKFTLALVELRIQMEMV